MSREFQGYIYLALAMTTVGSTVIASKVIASGLPPFTATALRFAVAFPFFLCLMRWTGSRLPRRQGGRAGKEMTSTAYLALPRVERYDISAKSSGCDVSSNR